jgi:shikimate kinase
MGVGKSTTGRLLAELLGREFIDTDHAIETRTGRTIAEIFETEGEPGFRRIEAETIEAVSRSGAVISLGGGALTPSGSVERLGEVGRLVYLRASVDRLIQRIGDPSSRPLLAGLDPAERRAKVEALLEERRENYERADHIIDADGSAVGVAENIARALGAHFEKKEASAEPGRLAPARGSEAE